MHSFQLRAALILISATALACAANHSKPDGDDEVDGDGGTTEHDGGTIKAGAPPDGPACFAHERTAEIAAGSVDSVDLVFVVDDSESMRDEQASLAAQFPKLIAMLTSGDTDDDGVTDIVPAQSLHLAVVSTDLGLPGVSGFDGCEGLGDDGLFRNTASPDVAGCSAQTYEPPFLTYEQEAGDDPAQLATDLKCLATLGVDDCTIEQPLESLLKAVWPGADPSVTFVTDSNGDSGFGQAGPGAPNGDFVRGIGGTSVIAVVVVTDKEDCSIRKPELLAPGASPNGLGTRCFFESLRGQESGLFQVDRYIQVLKALRPGQENLVIFGGIVGVPQQLVAPEAVAPFDLQDPRQAAAFHDTLLSAPELQESIDDKGTPDVLSDDSLRPSCDRGADGKAFPPRRIVQVAKGFGANGFIESICQDDFSAPIRRLVETIARQLGAVCLPRRLARGADGMIDCEVTWELPSTPIGDAPTACSDRPFLVDVERSGNTGRRTCKVAQLSVDTGTAEPRPRPTGGVEDGWYYDDFSALTQQSCLGSAEKQRIALTNEAEPPSGVTVKLNCFQAEYFAGNFDELTELDDIGDDLAPDQPTIGSSCDMVTRNNQVLDGDGACEQRLINGEVDTSMFCHASSRTCVLGCKVDADCPNKWFCDDSSRSVDAAGGKTTCSPGDTCSAGASSTSPAKVGDPCFTLLVPEGGFEDSTAYVEGNSPYCNGGACLVYHLAGDPRADCTGRGSLGNEPMQCADPQDVENRVYCSCRCDAPEGYDECQCPDGFSCVDVLDNAPREITGSYCVRNGTVSQ